MKDSNSPEKDIVLLINSADPDVLVAIEQLEHKLERKLSTVLFVNGNSKQTDESSEIGKDVSGIVKVDFTRPSDIQEKLLPIEKRILLVFCRKDKDLQFYSELIPFLPFCMLPSKSSVVWSNEKLEMRKRFLVQDPNLVPKFWNISIADNDIEEKLRNIDSWPVMIKPNGLANSMLVKKCENYNDLATSMKSTVEIISHIYDEYDGNGEKLVVVEEFMSGEMFSIDGYVDDYGNISLLPIIKIRTGEEMGLSGYYTYDTEIPYSLPESDVNNANEACISGISALKLKNCSVHIELFKTGQGWKIIEMAPRTGGHRNQLYKEAFGIDHIYNELLVKIGLKPNINVVPIRHARGFLIFADFEGKIKSVSGFDELQKIGSLVWSEQFLFEGDNALFSGNGGHSVIEGILSNEDKAVVEKDYKKIRELIKIEIE